MKRDSLKSKGNLIRNCKTMNSNNQNKQKNKQKITKSTNLRNLKKLRKKLYKEILMNKLIVNRKMIKNKVLLGVMEVVIIYQKKNKFYQQLNKNLRIK